MKRSMKQAGGHPQYRQQQMPSRKQPPKQPAMHSAMPSANGKPFRLPDKASFHLMYSAATQSWTGSLQVEQWSRTATARGVHGLVMKLGQAYQKEKGGET